MVTQSWSSVRVLLFFLRFIVTGRCQFVSGLLIDLSCALQLPAQTLSNFCNPSFLAPVYSSTGKSYQKSNLALHKSLLTFLTDSVPALEPKHNNSSCSHASKCYRTNPKLTADEARDLPSAQKLISASGRVNQLTSTFKNTISCYWGPKWNQKDLQLYYFW